MATLVNLSERQGMDKEKALETALSQIERSFGKGSIMKLGQDNPVSDIEAVSTGSTDSATPEFQSLYKIANRQY